MKITIKLFSNLLEYLPKDADGNQVELSLAPGTTANQAVAMLGVPRAEVRTVMKNGAFLAEDKRDKALQDGDVLTVWPAIQGG